MKTGCCLHPLEPGTAIIRDIRTWHGGTLHHLMRCASVVQVCSPQCVAGTPNISDAVRAMPSTNYFAPWYNASFRRCMPRSIYAALSSRAQELCRYIVFDEDDEDHIELGWRPLGPLGSATHALTPQRMQELRNEPGRGSQTGYWPPEGAGGGPEELQLPKNGSEAKL
eukprot:SAG31_NODE_3903_length_3768_cov_2.589806_3_plen_168_part_00